MQWLVLILCLSVGCSPCARVVSSHQRDSIAVEVRPRVVEFRDTLCFEIEHCVERVVVAQDSSFLSNPYSFSVARILPSGELLHTLESPAQSIGMGHDVRVEVRDSIIYRTREETHVVEVERELTRWQQIQMRGFWMLSLLVMGFLFGKKWL